MYEVQMAAAVAATGATTAVSPAGAPQQAAHVEKCSVFAESAAGDQSATIEVQGQPLGGTEWTVVGTITLSAASPGGSVDLAAIYPKMRLNITALGVGVTVNAWLVVYNRQG